MTDQTERQILISHTGDAAFRVQVHPPLYEGLDGTFPTHREARGWASGLRMTRGWRIIDLASDAALSNMLKGDR